MNDTELYGRAFSSAEAGQIYDALRQYEELLSKPGVDSSLKAKVYNDLGVISYSAGDDDRAESFLRRSIFSNLLFEDAYRNLLGINARRVKDKTNHRFSIVIPTFNRCSDLQRSVNAIRKNSFYPFEIIVVTEPCHDGTIEYLEGEREKGDIVAIVNETRLGTTISTNTGFSVATGSYVSLLSDDVIVTPGWDLAIVQTIDDDPAAGCAVPLVAYPDGRVQSPGQYNPYKSRLFDCIGKVPFVDTAQIVGNFIENFPLFQLPRECDYGYFPVMKRECFEKVGHLDEQYKHYFVDPDLGYRIQAAGYKNIYCPTSVLVHYELSKKDMSTVQERFNADLEKFVKKWGIYQYR